MHKSGEPRPLGVFSVEGQCEAYRTCFTEVMSAKNPVGT